MLVAHTNSQHLQLPAQGLPKIKLSACMGRGHIAPPLVRMPIGWLHSHALVGNTNWTQGFINSKKGGHEVGRVMESEGIRKEVVMADRHGQNTLYKCMKF